MFNDLSQNNLSEISVQQAKAYPSVNSSNDGSYNSEDNLRWLTKGLATKTFVVGNKDNIVNDSFNKLYFDYNGVGISSGFAGIDGYLIKLSDNENISFDDTSTTIPLTSINTQYAQRFVKGLLSSISQDSTEFLFSDYYIYSGDATTLANLATAYAEQSCIGYIPITYSDTYYSALTITQNSVSFGINSISILNTTISNNSADAIRTVLQTAGYTIGNNFAIADSQSSTITIYYAIYISDSDVWNETDQEYNKQQAIQFKDIFGLQYQFESNKAETKSYPITGSIYLSMQSSNTKTQYALGSFSQCQRDTMPNTLYDFTTLYTGGVRNTTMTSPIGTIEFPYAALTSIFDIIQTYSQNTLTQSLLTTYMPSGLESYPDVQHNMLYYCINNIDSSNKLSVTNFAGNTVSVPVAFMTSSGNLCPDGFITGLGEGSQTLTTYPVEGYLHWVKRMYLSNQPSAEVTEENIQAVTLQQLLSWSGFNSLYNTYLAKPMSAYMHMAYCGLIDYVVDSGTGYNNIKANGCGVKLLNSSLVVHDNVFTTEQDYNAVSYTYNSSTISYAQTTTAVQIQYNKDATSDYEKLANMKYGSEILIDGMTIDFYSESYSNSASLNDKILKFDDPLNYIRGCASYSSSSNTISGNAITMYRIANSTADLVSIGTFSNLSIDKYLCPTTAQNPIPAYINPNTFGAKLSTHFAMSLNENTAINSIVSGMCYSYNVSDWIVKLPCVLTVNKDAYNYLMGKDFDNQTLYDGVSILYKLPSQLTQDDLYLFGTDIQTIPSCYGFEREQLPIMVDTLSKYSKVRREAFLHVNKIYGKDFMTLEDIILSLIKKNTDDIQSDIQNIDDEQSIANETMINNYDNSMKVLRSFIVIGTGDTTKPPIPPEGIDPSEDQYGGWDGKQKQYYYLHNLKPDNTERIEIPFEFTDINTANMNIGFFRIPRTSGGITYDANTVSCDWFLSTASGGAHNLVITIKNISDTSWTDSVRVCISYCEQLYHPKFLAIFNPNGGECDTLYQTIVYSMTYGFDISTQMNMEESSNTRQLPTPTYIGHTFLGWYTAQTGGTQVTENTEVTTLSNVILYAHWTQ